MLEAQVYVMGRRYDLDVVNSIDYAGCPSSKEIPLPWGW